MPVEVPAVYENGVLRPLQPLHLAENERVIVSLTQAANDAAIDMEFVQGLRQRLEEAGPAKPAHSLLTRLPDAGRLTGTYRTVTLRLDLPLPQFVQASVVSFTA